MNKIVLSYFSIGIFMCTYAFSQYLIEENCFKFFLSYESYITLFFWIKIFYQKYYYTHFNSKLYICMLQKYLNLRKFLLLTISNNIRILARIASKIFHGIYCIYNCLNYILDYDCNYKVIYGNYRLSGRKIDRQEWLLIVNWQSLPKC